MHYIASVGSLHHRHARFRWSNCVCLGLWLSEIELWLCFCAIL